MAGNNSSSASEIVRTTDTGRATVDASAGPRTLPEDWAERRTPYLPASTLTHDFHPARVFPATGARRTDQEGRATSIALSTIEIVEEFGQSILLALSAPAGRIEAFVEPRFALGSGNVRPDGMLHVTDGFTHWTALIEVKTGTRTLRTPQIETYLAVAKERRFDAVITISPQLQVDADTLPVRPAAGLLKDVRLHHLSWEEIIAAASTALHHTGIKDPTSERLLRDFLVYATDPASGMLPFDDMGKHWGRVCDAIETHTVGSKSAAAANVWDNFDRLTRHIALQLSTMLGEPVTAVRPPEPRGTVAKTRSLADTKTLTGTLRIKGLVGPLTIRAVLDQKRISCGIAVLAPRSERATTDIGWLLSQLRNADRRTRIASCHAGCDRETPALLRDARTDPTILVPLDGCAVSGFTVTTGVSLRSKRSRSQKGFVTVTTDLVNRFYDEIARGLVGPD